jgi:hypothetical protein
MIFELMQNLTVSAVAGKKHESRGVDYRNSSPENPGNIIIPMMVKLSPWQIDKAFKA